MADRICASCGGRVGILADRCPVCGGDPDVRLIQLGNQPRRPAGAGPAPGGRSAWRGWAPIAAALVVLWAVFALTAGGSPEGDDEAERAAVQPTTTAGEQRGTVSRPPRSTTTTAAQVLPGAPLLGEPNGLTVVLVGDRTTLVDLDTGAVRRNGNTVVVGATTAGLLVSGGGGLRLWPPPFDGTVEVDLHAPNVGQAWVTASGEGLWYLGPPTDARGAALTAVHADLAGNVLSTRPLGQFDWAPGVLGERLVISAPGGTYLVDVDGDVERISTGAAQAAVGSRLFVANCDPELRCGYEVFDADGRLVDRSSVEQPGFGYAVAAADDGRTAFVVEDGADSYVSVDGTSVLELGYSIPTAMAWSPDGRWLAVAGHGNAVSFVDTFTGGPAVAIEVDPSGQESPPYQVFLVANR